MADETVSVRINLHDAITMGLVEIEHQAKSTGRALKDMDDGTPAKNLKKTAQQVEVNEKGLRGLRLKALDLGFAFKAIKIPALATAVVQATSVISSLSAGLVGLVSNLAPTTTLVAALPSLLGAVVSSMMVVKLGMHGVTDAVKTLNKEGVTVGEVQKAMKGLSPSAQAFARALAGVNPKMKDLRKSIGDAMLPGFTKGLRHAIGLFPTFKTGLTSLGKTIGDLATKGGQMISSGPFKKDLGTILQRNNKLVSTGGDALLLFVSALRHVMIAAGPMAQAIMNSIKQLAGFINHAAEAGRTTGKLEAFFNRAWESTKRWGRTLANFGVGLFNIFKGGKTLGDDMSGSLEKVSATFRRWTGSMKGKSAIKKWFDDARPIMSELGKLVVDVAKAFGHFDKAGRKTGEGAFETIHAIRTKLVPVLDKLITSVSGKLGPAIVTLAEGIGKLLNFASFSPLIVAVDIIGKLLNWFIKVADWVPGLNQLVTGVIALGLGMKTLALVKKFTGLDALITMFKDGGTLNRGIRYIWTFGAPGGGLDGIRLRFMYVKDAVVGAARAVWEFVAAQAAAAWTKIKSGLDSIALGFMYAKDKIYEAATAVWAYITTQAPLLWARVKDAAAVAWETVCMVAHTIAQWAGVAASYALAAATWAVNVAMDANPIMLVVLAIVALAAGVIYAYTHFKWFRSAIDAVWQGIQAVWDIVLRFKWFLLAALLPMFAPLIIIIANWGHIKDAIGWVIDKVRDLIDWFGRAGQAAVDMVKKIPGVGLVMKGVSAIFGDTPAPRGQGGNLGRTIAAHSAISAATPGRQYVTNVTYGAYRGSDHVAGRAMDLVGSGLQTYAKAVRALGGYAAFHGGGDDRHLHAVYGDTARPRGGRGVGGDTFVLEGPLIGTVYAQREMDVEAAVKRGIADYNRERAERGHR